jgi:hypothetical protein
MLPRSVEPRAKMKITSRQAPVWSSLEVLEPSWRLVAGRAVTIVARRERRAVVFIFAAA